MTAPFPTTGVPTAAGPNGSVPVRREVRDLQKNNPLQWNLFCLGLRAFQATDESDQLSFYQIAGIHGLPYQAWNGVAGIDGQQTGYCTHSSILFLPWHRPYLALFEQVLYNKIQEIANAFPDNLKAQYVSAAQDFRLPYWDWALQPSSGGGVLPSSVGGAQIQVTGTDGKTTTIPNPLEHYQFQNIGSGDFPDPPFNTWVTTHRYPRDTSPNTTSQDSLINSSLNSQLGSIRSQVRYVMSSVSDFGAVSNDKWIPAAPGTYPSLEDIHDNIHVLCGGPSPRQRSAPPGHMSDIPYAAFDPIFWLHHCNVDRLFAIWQALYPDSYVVPEPTSDGTFTEQPGSTEDINSDLTPFWFDSNTFHNPKNARSTQAYGYAYPETESWNYATPDLYQQSVRAAINKLYGSTFSGSSAASISLTRNLVATSHVDDAAKGKQDLSREIKTPDSQNDQTSGKHEKTSLLSKIGGEVKAAAEHVKELVKPGDKMATSTNDHGTSHAYATHKYKAWIANIRVQKHCLGGAFQVHVFLGPVPANVDDYLTQDTNVGTSSILGSNPLTTSCEKCKTDASKALIVTGAIPLTEALLDAISSGELRSLEVNDVVPYLKKMLHWRVTQPDGTQKPSEEVDDLLVSVVSTDVTESTNPHELPVYSGEYTLHPECTEGKPAGYTDGDQY